MIRAVLAFTLSSVALLGVAGSSEARNFGVESRCEVDSDYRFTLSDRSLIYIRAEGQGVQTPERLVIRDGRLFVDDAWVDVSAADRARLREYERIARGVMPVAQEIALDASSVVFAALGEVAASLGRDHQADQARFASAQAQFDARLRSAIDVTRYSSADIGSAVGDVIGDILPELIGDVVAGSIRAALTGDSARLEQLQTLDARIESSLEPLVGRIERNADVLCERMQALAGIEAALEFRLADGRSLNLLRYRDARRAVRN